MKILMICGTYPPEKCGIGDYLFNIVQEIKKEKDVNIEFIVNINWSTKNIFHILKQIKKISPDIIHIQYPSQGYGLSFIPHLVSVFYQSFVTVHEVKHVKLLRRLSLFFFSLRAKVIFTNKFEYTNFKNIFPWYKKEPIIIPIGSNINIDYHPKTTAFLENDLRREIIYFGQIRPKKGIEDLMELSNLISKDSDGYRVVIMGQLLPAFKGYWEELSQKKSNYPNIDWRLNLSEMEIESNLKRAAYAYLPFPDGISERRGSFFAALACGTPIFSTSGPQTTSEISQIVHIVTSPEIVCKLIQDNSLNYFYQKLDHVKIAQFLQINNWNNISEKHLNLYKKG